jgi:hypothetical protein
MLPQERFLSSIALYKQKDSGTETSGVFLLQQNKTRTEVRVC